MNSKRIGILVVDDQDDLRRLVARALHQAGFDVAEASNGEEALAALAAAQSPMHLLITDVVMPGMNGCELARQVHSSRPGMRILLMSGCSGHLVKPGLAFLQKPFAIGTLLREIRRLLDSCDGELRAAC